MLEWFRRIVDWLSNVKLSIEFVVAIFFIAGLVHQIVRRNLKRKARDWRSRLNEHFSRPTDNAVRIHREYKSEPRIIINGPYSLSPEQESYAQRERELIKEESERARERGKKPFRTNDDHAILVSEPDWNSDPVTFEVQTLDYASVLALKNEEPRTPRPRRISANAVLICRETEEVILHLRADKSETFPDTLHTMGGSYKPPGNGPVDDDDKLSSTVIREVHEESKASINLDDHPPMLIMEELRTGFVQLVFLGVNISADQNKHLVNNVEGKEIVRVEFSQLQKRLVSQQPWVPTGKAAVLAWLAFRAPNAGRKPIFGDLTATELFDSIVRHEE